MKTIIKDDSKETCYICGRRPDHVHHMLHGAFRRMADVYGLTCHLCNRCHTLLHDKGVKDRELQRDAQKAFEEVYGHAEFMAVFGRDFL